MKPVTIPNQVDTELLGAKLFTHTGAYTAKHAYFFNYL